MAYASTCSKIKVMAYASQYLVQEMGAILERCGFSEELPA